MNRIMKLKLILLLLCLSIFSACQAIPPKEGIPLVDTHVHLFDLHRLPGLPWPDKSDKTLYKSILAPDYNKLIKQHKVAAVIMVEASPRVSDNDWLLDHTEAYKDKYIGLIGALEFDKETFKDDFTRLCKNPRFLGLRIGTQYLDKPHNKNYLKGSVILNNLQQLSDAKKTLDVLIYKLQLEDVKFIAKKYPHLNIIINHVGGVQIDGRIPSKEWQNSMKEAASFPNVYCKISGLFQRSSVQPAPKNTGHYQKVLEIVYEQFGEDRIIFGSNWPCTLYSGDFGEHKAIVDDSFKTKGPRVLKKLYYKNAESVYHFKLNNN